MSSDKEVIHSMAVDEYIEHWDKWQLVREVVTNAMDASPDWSMERISGKYSDILVVKNSDKTLKPEHMIIGITGHERGDSYRGQFGEGLKMAMLVLTRFGQRMNARSGQYLFWNEPAEKLGHKIFKICWEDGLEYHDGTTVEIPWQKTDPSYEERFLKPGDERIAWTDDVIKRQILRQDEPDFFHKGVWVSKAKYYSDHFAFGYNLVTTKLDRDRRVIDGWEAASEVGKIWGSVQNEELLDLFWDAVQAGAAEKESRFWNGIDNSEAMQSSFKNHFGRWAVIGTTEEAKTQAEYMRATVVDVGRNLSAALGKVLETDLDYVKEMQGSTRVPIKDNELPEEKLTVLRKIRRLAKKVNFKGKIQSFILGDATLAEAHNGNIRIDPSILEDERKAVKALIHELAHTDYGAADRTPEMEDAILNVAADLVLGGR